MPRQDHCGKYERTPEIRELQRQRALAHWADIENRRRHGDFIKKRMARPGVSERISVRTIAALAARGGG